ncbi:MAG: PqqD family protein [Woeseiaceae bacterium]
MSAAINLESKFVIPPQVMSRLVGDETILMDLSTGIYFGLDGVGQRIWETIGEGRNLADVAAIIAAEYEVDEHRAKDDAIEFIGELVERGLLQAN